MRGGTGVAGSRHLAWSGLSSPASPGCHPTYLPPAVAQVPRGWVGTWGLSHFGERGGDQAPSPAKAPAWRSPTRLGFRPKKGRKEAAGPALLQDRGRGARDSPLCLMGAGTAGPRGPRGSRSHLQDPVTLTQGPQSPPKKALRCGWE